MSCKRPNWPVVNLRAICFFPSDSVGPSGKLLQLRWGERRSKREGESWVAKRRSQISQWLHGVMYLWSAAMDCNPRSLLLILHILLSCVILVFPIIYPPNEGKGTLRHVCWRVGACMWTARIAGDAVRAWETVQACCEVGGFDAEGN